MAFKTDNIESDGYITGSTLTATTAYISNLNILNGVTGLPIDIRVTGGTYTAGTATFTNNTGGTFSVSGFLTGNTSNPFTGGTVTGGTQFTGGLTANTIILSAGTVTSGNTDISFASANINNFLEYNVQNTNTLSQAQGGYAATADNGSLTTGFVWMGINNSNFNFPTTYNIGGGNDVSFLGSGQDMYIANANNTKSIIFSTGIGILPFFNEKMRITNAGNILIGTSATTNSSILQVSGNSWISGGLTANTISATTYQNLPVNATSQSSPSDPSTTTSSTGVMMGLSGSITPTSSGKIMIVISGDIDNSSTSNTAQIQMRTGTGTVPSNGGALTGTTRGGLVKVTNPTVGLSTPVIRSSFSLNCIITGLTLNTTVWIDVGLAAIGGGTSRVRDISISAFEI